MYAVYDLNLVDVFFIVVLSGTVPFLVHFYLSNQHFPRSARNWVIAGGILWMLYVVLSEWVSDVVIGAPWLDAHYHDYWGKKMLESVRAGDWTLFWEHFRSGNHAYHCYLAFLYSTGASIYTPTAVNGWFAFWAGLILAYHFSTFCAFPKNRPFLLFWTIFCPSVVFWCTVNLKESMMYWAVANIYAVSFVQKRKNYSLPRIAVTGLAIAVGALLRPHILVGWVAAVAVVNTLHRGRRLLAFLVLLSIPFVFVSMQQLVPVDFSQEAGAVAEKHFKTLQSIQHQGSQIVYEGEKPVFFVSGFLAAFFRPFPWEIRSLRILAGSLEVWTMTFLIFYAWYNLRKNERNFLLRLPMTRVAILGALWMCILLTYYPNEGLMLRQRVQMIPGLLALAVLPASLRYVVRAREGLMKATLMNAYDGTPDAPMEQVEANAAIRRPKRIT